MPQRLRWSAVLLAACLLAAAGGARAQTPFALRSVGQRLADGDARMHGRGGWGLVVADSTHPGFKNPASTAWVRKIALSVTGYGENAWHESPGASRVTDRTFVPDVRVAVPVRKGLLAFSTGLALENSTAWSTKVDSTWVVWDDPRWQEWGAAADTLAGNEQFERQGSTFRVPLALAWRVTPQLAAAAAVNFERGSLREQLSEYYLSPANGSGVPDYRSVVGVSADEFTGTSTTLAALLTPRPQLRFGLAWTSAHDLDVSRKTELSGVADRSRSSFTLHRPAELAAGFAAPLGGRWEVGGDWRRQDWRRFTGPDAWLAEPGWRDQLADEVQVAFGVERRAARVRRGGLDNAPVRLGATWHRWPYRVGGHDIVERSLSVGTGFPLYGDNGFLDVAVTYGLVGDQADNGLDSRYLRLSVSVTGLEGWW